MPTSLFKSIFIFIWAIDICLDFDYLIIIMADIKRLKQIKERRHISLETMAREIGISSRTLFRWFHLKFKPSLLAQRLIGNYIKKQE